MCIKTIKKLLKRVTILITITTSLFAFSPIEVNAAWKQNKFGWWYTEGNSWATGWRLIDGSWYYFSKTGYMNTGWVCDGFNWYYLNSDGSMVSSTMIDGNKLDSSGKCIDFITAEDAKAAMLKEDGVYVNSLIKNSNLVIGDNSMISLLSKHYRVNEEVYAFYFQKDEVFGVEFVGVKTKNVYRGGSNGGEPLYLIKDNKIAKQFDWID